jgi:hypothetical protein
VRRAFAASDLVRGRVDLTKLTIGQAAALLRVCPAYVRAALKAAEAGERLMVLQGYKPLIPSKPKKKTETLAEHLVRATAAERAAAAKVVGADAIWDSMMMPALS